jgi:hypothetical protein
MTEKNKPIEEKTSSSETIQGSSTGLTASVFEDVEASSVWDMHGPTASHMGSAATATAWSLGLKIQVQQEKGWFRSSWVIQVTGPKSKVDIFDSWVQDSLISYNKHVPS